MKHEINHQLHIKYIIHTLYIIHTRSDILFIIVTFKAYTYQPY